MSASKHPKKLGEYRHTPRFVRKIQTLLKNIPMAFGVDLYKHTEDRRVLETQIFPYFVSSAQYSRVLFVGCAWYTRGYNSIFRSKEYQTIETDPLQSKYGAKNHVTDSIENITRHVDEGGLDLIICNGVFGWGLNEKLSAEKAFEGCFRCLRPGGVFILGWNDTPERSPFSLDECQSLKSFQPFVFPPLSTAQYRVATPSKHVYSFFVRNDQALD